MSGTTTIVRIGILLNGTGDAMVIGGPESMYGDDSAEDLQNSCWGCVDDKDPAWAWGKPNRFVCIRTELDRPGEAELELEEDSSELRSRIADLESELKAAKTEAKKNIRVVGASMTAYAAECKAWREWDEAAPEDEQAKLDALNVQREKVDEMGGVVTDIARPTP